MLLLLCFRKVLSYDLVLCCMPLTFWLAPACRREALNAGPDSTGKQPGYWLPSHRSH